MSPSRGSGSITDAWPESIPAHRLLRRGRGTTLLLVTAYATAVVGLGLSLFLDPGSGRTVGIALMFVAFAALFVASLRIVDATGAGDAGRSSRGR